jgi:plastocyanin
MVSRRDPRSRWPQRIARRQSCAGAIVVAFLLAACQAGPTGTARTSPQSPSSSPVGAGPPAATASADTRSPSPTASTAIPSAAVAAGIDPRSDGLDVTFGEFAITLEASTIRPGPVTLVVRNGGHLTHGFEMKIESGHGSGGDRKKIETRTFRSGETLRVEADLPAGTYEVECFVADHASLGMKTSLEVRPDAPLTSAAPGGSGRGTVRIVQFAFVAASMDVVAGGSVTWTNEDPTPHTVTADGGAFDSRQLDAGGRFSTVLPEPGNYAYHCEIHPTMVGTVHVS